LPKVNTPAQSCNPHWRIMSVERFADRMILQALHAAEQDIRCGANVESDAMLRQKMQRLALSIIAVESSLSATFLDQRKHRVDRWCRDFDEAAQFLDGGDECINL
jgi:hypothetical protein